MLRCRGASTLVVPQLSLELWRGVCEEERRWVFSRYAVVRCFWSFGLGRGLLLVRRAYVVFSLAVVCAGGSLYHGGEFVCLNTQWQLAVHNHLRTFSSRFMLRVVVPCFYFPSLMMALAAPVLVRRFSAATDVWWFLSLLPPHSKSGVRRMQPFLLGAAFCAGGCYEALGEMFSAGSLSLRADH
ncbi:hypothetical protein DY000_02030252 [Brassica cretica]|uniref:Mannosyltransferase n=1 Tax=Brassica cretica TaxID=69181 RepID=A0ABQ7DRR3_BRACR|nr:hypothetical protein DY000_02030252 [Brassica cretica]